jgi:ribosome-associated protein YbcJ (S4-like RNA binding protein)
MSGLRRVGKLRKGMTVDYYGERVVILGFPNRNTVSAKVIATEKLVKVDVETFTKRTKDEK